MRRPSVLLFVAVVLAAGRAGAQAPTLPTTELPSPERRAVALEAGALLFAAEATSAVRTRFDAGRIFVYFGETTDAFGRTWSVVGDPDAWRRQRTWLVLPERFAHDVEPGAPLAFLDTLGSPAAATGTTRRAVRVRPGWWREPRELAVVEPPRLGELLGVPAYRIPAALLDEVLGLLGGREALGPWPESPVRGQIHVGTSLPLVYFHDDGWETGTPARSLSPVLGLLGNPLLEPDTDAPGELTGLAVPCWSLTGGLDATGAAVGLAGEAPEEPARVPGSERGEDPLGARDFTRLGWPVADEEMAAPRRVLLEERAAGVLVEDVSARQAVYLEQSLAPEATARLRGRTLRLRVFARAAPQAEAISSVAVGIELEAGGERTGISAQVGLLSTPLEAELVVPEDAETVTVRLLPQDLSIAVAERGRAVFDRVSLAPVEWPVELTPDPLALRRTMVVGYEARRAYTRAPLAISERGEGALADAFPRLGEREIDRRRLILAGELAAGMTADEVRLAWGEASNTVELGGLVRRDWPGRSATFRSEQVVAWTTTPPRGPEPIVTRCGIGGAGPR